MIVEHRTYTFRPGTVEGWRKLYEGEGLAIQKRHLNRFLGLYISEIGRLNTIVLMWGYDNLADREAQRTTMYADPAWRDFMAKVTALNAIQSQDDMIMDPAPSSPDA